MNPLLNPRTITFAASIGLSLLVSPPPVQDLDLNARVVRGLLTTARVVPEVELPRVALAIEGQDAQDALDAQGARPEVVTRVYSLRPLVQAANESLRDPINADVPRIVSDTVLLGQLYAGRTLAAKLAGEPAVAPQPMDAAGPPADKQVVPQLIEIIMSAVEPESWVDLGGPVGQITYLRVNNSLVVTQTPEAQAKVADLLASIQDRRVVSTQARLVRVDSPRIDQSVRIEQGVSVFEGDVAGLPTVAEVRVSGFDGQTQLVKDGQGIPYLSNVMPVVSGTVVGYQASVAQIDTGLTLKVTPVLNADGNQVTLEISAEYLLVDKADAPNTPTTRPAGDAAVLPDLIPVDRRALALALRVPAGRWVLVGSMGASRDGAPADSEPLHLLIRVDTGNVNAGGQP